MSNLSMFSLSHLAIPADVLKKTVVLGKYHRVALRVAIGSPHCTGSVLQPASSFVVTVVTSTPRAVSARSMSRIARLGPPCLSETDGMTCRIFNRPAITGCAYLMPDEPIDDSASPLALRRSSKWPHRPPPA